MWMEPVLGPGGLKATSGLVELTHQPGCCNQGGLGTGIRWQPVPTSGPPLRIRGHLPVDEREDLPAAVFAENTRRAGEPTRLQVPQVSCTAPDHVPIGRSSCPPRRTTPAVILPPGSGTSSAWPASTCTRPVWVVIIILCSPQTQQFAAEACTWRSAEARHGGARNRLGDP